MSRVFVPSPERKWQHLPGKRLKWRKVPGEWATPSRKTPRIKEGPGRMDNTFQEKTSNQGRSRENGQHLPGKGLKSRKVPRERPTPSRKTPQIKEGPNEKTDTFQENASESRKVPTKRPTPSRERPQIKEGPKGKADTFQENASNQGRSRENGQHLPGKRLKSRKVPGEWTTPSRKKPRIKEGPWEKDDTFQENASESRKVPGKRTTPSRNNHEIKEGPNE